MSKKKPEAMVIYGDGINCENETAWALELAGFQAQKVLCGDLLETPGRLQNVKMLAFPGGFSFGDEIASGRVLAVKLKEKLQEALRQYVAEGNLVIGICNGFQILVQLALLPDSSGACRSVSLCHNESGKFINKWVKLEVTAGTSRFFEGLSTIHLPIRHGEGRLTVSSDLPEEIGETVKKQAPLRYSEDVNGSYDRIAALTNAQGNILGLMPHPEAFVRWNQHPAWGELRWGAKGAVRRDEDLMPPPDFLSHTPPGLQIFKNAAMILS